MAMDAVLHELDGGDASPSLGSELDAAFALLERGFGMLLESGARGELAGLGPDGLIAAAKRFEAHRTRLMLMDGYVVEAAIEERLDEHVGARTPAAALASVLRISRAEASARAARAGQLLPREGFSAGALPAELPVLAEAVEAGAVTTDQVRVIGTTIRRLATNPSVGAEQVGAAEVALVRHAAALGPSDLAIVAARIDDALLPDGALPDDRIAGGRRGLRIGAQRRDGTHPISGFLTRGAKALVDAALGPLSAPRPEDAVGDIRTAPQRLHDALEDACRRLLDSAGVPASGGTAATVHITVDLDRLREQIHRYRESAGWSAGSAPAVGRIAGGQPISFAELAQLAREAELVPVWASSSQGIVGYGRDRRIATAGQTNALISRDGGCSFPGCSAPPDWCQRHHVVPWWDGGRTDLNNLTLVCGHHHREFENAGWSVQIVDGLPWWSPPAWLDPQRAPLLNTRIRIPDEAEIVRIAELVRSRPRESGPPMQRWKRLDELLDQLTGQIDDEEAEEFRYELDLLMDSYLGPNAPAARAA